MSYVLSASPGSRTEWSIHGDKFLQGSFRFIAEQLSGKKTVTATARDDANYESLVACRGLTATGKSVQDGTSLLCEEEPGYNPANPSRSGFEIDIEEMKPSVEIIMLGTYPTKYKDELPPNFLKFVRSAVSKAQKYGAQVVLIGPFANDAYGKRLAALRSVVPDTINGYDLVAGLPRERNSFLLTQDGYKALATRIVTAVTDTLNRRLHQRISHSTFPTTSPPPIRPPAQPGAGGQPTGSQLPPPPQLPELTRQEPMVARTSTAPVPVWVWSAAGLVGLVVLAAVLLRRRSSLGEYGQNLHERIAKALGWSVADVQSFPLATLRELVRQVSPELVREIDQLIRSGEVIRGSRYKRPRRY